MFTRNLCLLARSIQNDNWVAALLSFQKTCWLLRFDNDTGGTALEKLFLLILLDLGVLNWVDIAPGLVLQEVFGQSEVLTLGLNFR